MPDPPLVIVLDDVHVLRSGPLLDELSLFIERLPPPVRVVATSRVDPQLPLGRWRAAGRLIEVRQEDLRFTDDEARGPLRSERHVRRAARRTWRSWPSGPRAGRRGCNSPCCRFEAVTTRTTTSGRRSTSDRGIVDYLLGEVLASLSPDDRRLVLDLSILDDFDADLAVAVTGRPDAAQRVRSLETRNLLLLPADNRGERFRFHQLLRDLLVAELRWQSPGSRPASCTLPAAAHLELVGRAPRCGRPPRRRLARWIGPSG